MKKELPMLLIAVFAVFAETSSAGTYTPICGSMGDEATVSYFVPGWHDSCGDGDGDGIEAIATKLYNNVGRKVTLCQEEITIGSFDCIGRCGPGCSDSLPHKQTIYTRECLKHDLCTAAFGSILGSCRKLFAKAEYGFWEGTNCRRTAPTICFLDMSCPNGAREYKLLGRCVDDISECEKIYECQAAVIPGGLQSPCNGGNAQCEFDLSCPSGVRSRSEGMCVETSSCNDLLLLYDLYRPPYNHQCVEFQPDVNTVALWHLNGDGNDSSVNSNDLSIRTDKTDWINSYGGCNQGILMTAQEDWPSCFQSDGAAITGPGSGLTYPGSGDWTVEGWIYFPDTAPIRDHNIVVHYSQHWAGHEPYSLAIYPNSGSWIIRFMIQNNSNQDSGVVVDFSNYLNQWIHVAGVYRYQTSVSLYINGIMVGEVPTTIVPETLPGYDVNIGGCYCGTSTEMKVDEVRISKTARY